MGCHLWSGKFAQKTQTARFCLNESKRSNSFQRKGEEVTRESKCLMTEFFLMWIPFVCVRGKAEAAAPFR